MADRRWAARCQGLSELPAAKRQAGIALSTVASGGDGDTAARWTELSADALLAQFPQQSWADALLPAGVARLLADPAAPTLLPTLGTFLDCAGDVQRTAAQLRVHRTTLYYRLNRVGADLRAEPARRPRPAPAAPGDPAAPDVRVPAPSAASDRCRRTAAKSATPCRMTLASCRLHNGS